MKAFVMLTIEMGVEKTTCKFVENVKGVKKVVQTFGAYDAIVEVEVENELIMREILCKIREIKYIRNTLTIIGMSNE